MPLMTDKILVLSTCATAEEAEKVAHGLVERRLAACVNVIGPAKSIYRWQGAIESAEEHVLLIKSSRGLFEELKKATEQLHSYEVPELLCLPIVDGAPNYLHWLESEIGSK